MSAKKFSKKESIKIGWNIMKNNFWFFVGAYAFIILISYFPVIVASIFEKIELPTIFTVLFFIISLVFGLAQVVLSMGLIYISIKLVKGEKPVFKDLFKKANKIIDYIISSMIYSIIVTFGFILLIIPGIIFATRFQFYQYLIIDKNKGPIEALEISWKMTKGSVWNLFLLWLLFVLINIAGAIVLGIGLLATVPTTMIAMAWVYKKLDTKQNA